MGDGLKRAALESIRTRQWSVEGRTLCGGDVVALYESVPDERAMRLSVGAHTLSDRRADRALNILKKAGLIRFNRESRAWERT